MRISVGCGMVDFYYYFFFFESFGSGISQKNISQNATPSKNSAGRSDFFFAPSIVNLTLFPMVPNTILKTKKLNGGVQVIWFPRNEASKNPNII
jgi:hypothetical protein